MAIKKNKTKQNRKQTHTKSQCGTFYFKMYECIYFIQYENQVKLLQINTLCYLKKSIKIPKEKISPNIPKATYSSQFQVSF